MTERKHMGEWSLLWKILMAGMWHEEELLIMALKSKTGNCQLEAPDFQEKKKGKNSGENNYSKEKGQL